MSEVRSSIGASSRVRVSDSGAVSPTVTCTGSSTASKPIGPIYSEDDAAQLTAERGWTFKRDGDSMRRVVPSPAPTRIFEHRPIRWLLDQGCVVICAGGGGIPTAYGANRQLAGVEAVIDKDHASALLARDIDADVLIMATDAEAVFTDWGKPTQKGIHEATPESLSHYQFPAGSMGPKVDAACNFAEATGKSAAIGALADIPGIVDGKKGTIVGTGFSKLTWH